jgi:superfamily II DNA or RNA helicase
LTQGTTAAAAATEPPTVALFATSLAATRLVVISIAHSDVPVATRMSLNPYAKNVKRSRPWEAAESGAADLPPAGFSLQSARANNRLVQPEVSHNTSNHNTQRYSSPYRANIASESAMLSTKDIMTPPKAAASAPAEHNYTNQQPTVNGYECKPHTSYRSNTLHNPYAKSASEGREARKDDVRTMNINPFGANTIQQQVVLAAAPPPSLAAIKVAAAAASKITSTPAAPITFTSPAANTTSERNESADLFDDDDGFDWNSAIQTLDTIDEPRDKSSQNSLVQSYDTLVISTTDTKSASNSRDNSQHQPLTSTLTLQDLPAPPLPLTPPTTKTTTTDDAGDSAQDNETSSSTTAPPVGLPRPESWQVNSGTATAHPHTPVDPLQASLPPVLQYDSASLQPVTDEYRPLLVQHADLSSPLANGWTLFSHQKKAILRGLLLRRAILALDMGLGKTLIGCVWAKTFYKTMQTKAIVLCPVSLKKEWRRTAVEATRLALQDEKREFADDTTDVYIASWAKVPSLMREEPFVVIADEAHSMQNINASRTRDALQLMLSPQCVGVLLLTGTPMKNGKPANLFPLLKAIQHPLGRNQKAYEGYFCGGHDVCYGSRVTWQANGSAHLDQLRALVSSHVLYLTKEECLKDIPGQTRVFKEVPVSSRRQMQHQSALKELSKLYNQSKKSGDKDALLGAVQKVRMVGSLAKVEATVELAKSILENEPSIVIFTSFVEVAKQIRTQLTESGWKGELLSGETAAAKRQGMVDNFQSGLCSFIVCTFGAGGVGLTLTAASTAILVDRPWTPGDTYQAEDRLRRIGQTKPVTCIWVRAFDLDRQIDEMLDQKTKTTSAVLVGGGDEVKGVTDAPKLSIYKMLQAVLPTTEDEDRWHQTSILSFASQKSVSYSQSQDDDDDDGGGGGGGVEDIRGRGIGIGGGRSRAVYFDDS